jgi:predicted lipoprotein with Yx(FWY)xxD motif
VAVLAAAVLVLMAGCGGTDTGDTADTTSSGAPGPVLRAEEGPLGTVIVGRGGLTVYVFAKDTDGSSSCTGACATNWPPVEAPEPLPSALPGVTAPLGTAARDDGSTQLTVAGHPVYTFTGDAEPGQTNGQGRVLDGGLWSVVTPDGSPVTGPAPTTSPDDPPGGYGY